MQGSVRMIAHLVAVASGWLVVGGASPVHAAAAAAIFGPITGVSTAFTALLYGVAVSIVGFIVIKALASFANGDLGSGILGMFSAVAGASFAFVLMPTLTAAGVALGATLR